jgi:site-specific DNA recombinase
MEGAMGESEKTPRRSAKKARCAIYTRKSSEEGLEQAFNSLDAQREACATFILSQRHEGWTVLPTLYDDGGFSGGTMERPALKRLIADIDAGQIDVVVVYKVDRLTRALSDFAKLVEVFDRRGVSFVSITQQFNTTTSMGRLTLCPFVLCPIRAGSHRRTHPRQDRRIQEKGPVDGRHAAIGL